jgi:hypothetical protein
MPTPTIPAGNLFMNATTYTGTGASLAVTNGGAGASFQPDLVWIKSRSNSFNNELYDSIRGVQKRIISNLTNSESTSTTGLTSFNSNGFTQGGQSETGNNGSTYVGWQWKAGGTAVTNTAGSITSQVSANTTSGFSIVTYTGNATSGATVGHGLGVAPSFIIAKNRSSGVTDWPTFHVSTGNNGGCTLNETAVKVTTAIWWNNTTPSSSVVTLGSGSQTNGSTNLQVLYCWAPIAGYSAFGSYTGNGSTDGPFVYLGFRPRFVMIKRTDTAEAWTIVDTSRTTINKNSVEYLIPNSSDAEFTDTNSEYDILSNGLKFRDSGSLSNASGGTYIYMAFCENPFKYSNAR